MVLKGNKIILKTGLDENIYKTYQFSELAKLNDDLIKLKKQNPKEDSVILKPASNFKYDKIVKVIDHSREIVKPNVYITAVNDKNRKVPSKKLFERIIFETH